MPEINQKGRMGSDEQLVYYGLCAAVLVIFLGVIWIHFPRGVSQNQNIRHRRSTKIIVLGRLRGRADCRFVRYTGQPGKISG